MIKVGGRWISVNFKLCSEINNCCAGSFSGWRNNIQIADDPDTTQQGRHQAFLHELVEAINHYHELDMKHPVITSLSENLFQVLKDNGIWDKEFRIKGLVTTKSRRDGDKREGFE